MNNCESGKLLSIHTNLKELIYVSEVSCSWFGYELDYKNMKRCHEIFVRTLTKVIHDNNQNHTGIDSVLNWVFISFFHKFFEKGHLFFAEIRCLTSDDTDLLEVG